MEPELCGFKEYNTDGSLKLVPWISWDEWDTVRLSLFSSSHISVTSALDRVIAWRSRGCIPLVVEITASLIEIQQKDPYFRVDTDDKDAPESEEVLAMLYCMGIMRLVNGIVEKTRKKTEVSIGEAADAINIPRMLIDIRHECSHRDLPSLRLVRLASVKALDWLKYYYWEPQKKSLRFQSDGASRIKKEIIPKLCELAFFLEKKGGESTSPMKRKSSKKQISNAMKNLLRIYSSYSVEVVSVVVELLLKESGSSDCLSLDDVNRRECVLDYWKSAITKLSNKHPEFLLTLLRAVHKTIEIREANIHTSGELPISDDTAQGNINKLSNLYAWLVIIMKGLKSARTQKLPKSTLVELLRKSLLVSPRNKQLKCSALVLANMIGNNSLIEKVNKIFSLSASDPVFDERNSEIISTHQEEFIKEAAEKIDLFKLRKIKSKVPDIVTETNDGRGWKIVEKWKKCPIGMLSLGAASSGLLPFLDCKEDHNQDFESLEFKEQGTFVERKLKRKPYSDEFLNKINIKKKRENEREIESTYSLDVEAKLLIGGVWKKADEQELFAIAADIRVLV